MSEKNPWKTVSKKIVYQTEWFKLHEDAVIRPDGNPGTYSFVESGAAAGVVALTEENEIYLVGQYRYPNDWYSWEIPMGGAEDGESPLEAVKRELKEEAGLEAANWETLISEFHISNCLTSQIGHLFLARGITEGEANPDATEEFAVKKVPFAEALRMVDTGEIKDSPTVIAILQTARLLSDSL